MDNKIVKKVMEHRVVSSIFVLSFILVIVGWARAYFNMRGIPQPLIVHFNNAFGINQIGGIGDLSAVAVFAVIALILDLFLSFELDKKDPFIGKLTAAAGFFFAALIFIGLSAIVSVN